MRTRRDDAHSFLSPIVPSPVVANILIISLWAWPNSMSSDNQNLDEKDGYVVEQVHITDDLLFEDAAVSAGAPIEKVSPLGYHVDWFSVIFLVRWSHFNVFINLHITGYQQDDWNRGFYYTYVP